MGWEERARKLEKKKRQMVVQGRGLINVEPLATSKRLKKLKKSADSRRGRR
jgi:hypothetical protein